MSTTVALGADHAGFELKTILLTWLRHQGYEVQDMGASTFNAQDDYPDFTAAVAHMVASGNAERGLVICGSGVGASIAANKIPGVRASICHDIYSAGQGVEHDDMNVLVLGARIIGLELARELIQTYLRAKFTDEDRHRRRLEKIKKIESRYRCLLYTSPSPRDATLSRMPSSA